MCDGQYAGVSDARLGSNRQAIARWPIVITKKEGQGMCRLLAVLPLALLLVVAGGAGAAPPRDFVTGGGHHSVPDTQFTISAHSGPTGEDARGQLSFKIEGQPRLKAEVTCLVVTGNTAIATATYTDANGVDQVVVMEA